MVGPELQAAVRGIGSAFQRRLLPHCGGAGGVSQRTAAEEHASNRLCFLRFIGPRRMLPKAVVGGEGGIRTHGTVARTPHFECGAFDHSATSPRISRMLAAWGGLVAGGALAASVRSA